MIKNLARFTPLMLVLGTVAAHAEGTDFSTGVSSLQTAALSFCTGIVGAIFAFGAVYLSIPAGKWVLRVFAGLFGR